MKSFFDCHCHIQDERMNDARLAVIERAKRAGIGMFLLGGTWPEDWRKQLLISREYPDTFLRSFGLHPYWVNQNSPQQCEQALQELKQYKNEMHALGECGLDFRAEHISQGQKHQEFFFRHQVELAKNWNKPFVLHLVRAHEAGLKILREFMPLPSFMVHSFSGSVQNLSAYQDLGGFISFSGAILRQNHRSLHNLVMAVSWDRILVESDAPDQAPPSLRGQMNEPTTVFQVAHAIAQVLGKNSQEVLVKARENLIKMLNL